MKNTADVRIMTNSFTNSFLLHSLNFFTLLVMDIYLDLSLINGQFGEAAANNAVERIAKRLKKFTL